MMLAGTGERPLRVALATTHLPLKDVSAALTVDGIVETLGIIHRDLKAMFGLPTPRILVTGLNPHAGENGYLGREEIDVITPALLRARELGNRCTGSVSRRHIVPAALPERRRLRACHVSTIRACRS